MTGTLTVASRVTAYGYAACTEYTGNPGHIVGITHLFILTNFWQVSVKCLVLTKAAYYDNFPRNGSAVS